MIHYGHDGTEDSVAPAAVWRDFTGLLRLGTVAGAAGCSAALPAVKAPSCELWAVGAAPPAGAIAAMFPGEGIQGTGAGIPHWFPINPCWHQGPAEGEYGEPPTDCAWNMEMIWELDSVCCWYSGRNKEEVSPERSVYNLFSTCKAPPDRVSWLASWKPTTCMGGPLVDRPQTLLDHADHSSRKCEWKTIDS